LRRLRILGCDYIVDESQNQDTLGSFGKHIPSTNTICIASDLCKQQKEITLAHEILEALKSLRGLKIPHTVIEGLDQALWEFFTEHGFDFSKIVKKGGE
jgi:hypothetical protein